MKAVVKERLETLKSCRSPYEILKYLLSKQRRL